MARATDDEVFGLGSFCGKKPRRQVYTLIEHAVKEQPFLAEGTIKRAPVIGRLGACGLFHF